MQLCKNTTITHAVSALLFCLALSSLCACATVHAADKAEVMVLAAQSLKQPFTEISAIFRATNPGATLSINCAGSGSLAAQIAAGAPADVFASAGIREMDMLSQKGLLDEKLRRTYASNSVVLVAPAGNPGGLHGFRDLALPQIKRISVGDPRQAPIGMYTQQVLAYFGIQGQVKEKLIPCAQVAQVCDYTMRGETDAGIIYYSDYLAGKSGLALIEEAPAAAHDKVEYPVAVIEASVNKDYAGKFIALLCSDRGATVLKKYGFIIIERR